MRATFFSRRAFLCGAAAISASASLPMGANESLRSIEYVGTAESIEVYRADGGRKRKIQSLASQHPSSLTVDMTGRYLFDVNEVDEFQGLPTGSVESYGIEPVGGHLVLISRVPLSLSATMPKQLALSPDRRFMVVAAYGGGIYNVLPIGSNGEIGGVTQVVKEIGCGIHEDRQSSAHPHSVLFHPSGKFVFGTDVGADRINVFRINDGQMACVHRASAVPGSGPAGLAVDSSGSHILVRHQFNSSIGHYRFNSRSEVLTRLS